MRSTFSLDDLQLFHRVVQQGSLRAASKVTGIPSATLSRRIKNLEQNLGCRLLERSAHHFSLTDMGRHYFNQCGPLLDDLQSIAEDLDIDQHSLSGVLKITAPVNLTQQWLGKCFFEFMQAYPKIRLQLVLSNRYENLVEQQFDAAFRIGGLRDNSWIGRRIGCINMGFCATPTYMTAAPTLQHPRDLLQHHLIVADPIDIWALTHQQTGEEFSLTPQAHFRSSDIWVAMDAASANLGVTLVPSYYFTHPHYEHRSLVSVLPEWQGAQRQVNLLYRDRQAISARLRAFIDFVVLWEDKHSFS